MTDALALFPKDGLPIAVPSKSAIPANAESLCNALLEVMGAKDAYVYLYARAEVESAALELLKEKAALALRGKSEEVLGAVLESRKKPDRVEYFDGMIALLEDALKDAKDKLKARQEFNRTIPEGGIVDPTTGELIPPPKVTLGGETVAVKLRK